SCRLARAFPPMRHRAAAIAVLSRIPRSPIAHRSSRARENLRAGGENRLLFPAIQVVWLRVRPPRRSKPRASTPPFPLRRRGPAPTRGSPARSRSFPPRQRRAGTMPVIAHSQVGFSGRDRSLLPRTAPAGPQAAPIFARRKVALRSFALRLQEVLF